MFWEEKTNNTIRFLMNILDGKIKISKIYSFKVESTCGNPYSVPDEYRLINDIKDKYNIKSKIVGVWGTGLLTHVGLEIENGDAIIYQKFSG